MIAQMSAIVKKIVIKIVLFSIDKLQLVCYNVKAKFGMSGSCEQKKTTKCCF